MTSAQQADPNRLSDADASADAIELQPASSITARIDLPEHDICDGHRDEINQQEQHAPPAEAAIAYPSSWRLVMITLGLSLTIFLAALDSTIIAVAIPSITDQFGNLKDIAWYGTAYAITNTAFQSPWGKAYKYFELKPTYLSAIAVFEVGNVIAASAKNSKGVIVGRIVAGIGGGGIMTGSFIIIALTVKSQYRPAYMGILGVTFGVASVVGPLLGGALSDALSWRWCFWINLPIGALAAFIMTVWFSQPAAAVPVEASLMEKLINMDLNGGILVAGALSCFVMAMHWTGTFPWDSSQVLGSLVGSLALTALFISNERLMGSRAMLQSRLLKKHGILVNSLFAFFLAGMYFPLLYLLPILFQSVDNDSAAQSGVRLIPLVLGISVSTLLANALISRWRHYSLYLVVGGVAGVTGSSLLVATLASSGSSTFWAGEIVAAVGIGLSLQVPMIANQAAVGMEDIPAATSLSLFMENIGTSLFVAAAEAAMLLGLRNNLADVDPQAVINVGVTQLRSVFSPAEISAITKGYLEGCKAGHYLTSAAGSAALLLGVVSAAPSMKRALQNWTTKTHEG